ncbi:hypothetical protein LAZ67_13002615 [Cordylochernes scorpioides]|uniref:Mos1 transposase HTH domain-containing protein n=1 Tax=Cordylochernes scorpioides TaxID=51811 RepID=A0ABY6L4P6_9ARAC|nr:hypothetical protein LAZ67_13002615 [Cordylochernes scorpioides]
MKEGIPEFENNAVTMMEQMCNNETLMEDDDVPIDDYTTTKPLFTPQEKRRKDLPNKLGLKMRNVDIILFAYFNYVQIETSALMNVAYEDEKLSRTQVYFWYKRFKDGRKSIADDSRSGRALMSTTDRNIGQGCRIFSSR